MISTMRSCTILFGLLVLINIIRDHHHPNQMRSHADSPQPSQPYSPSPQPKTRLSPDKLTHLTPSTAEKTALKPGIEQTVSKQSSARGSWTWGSITYRDSVYYGRVLIQAKKESENQQSSFDTLDNKDCPRIKDGPGILMMDCAFWVIGNWERDQLTGHLAYVITADLGILRVNLSSPQAFTQFSWIGTAGKVKDQMKQYSIIGVRKDKQADRWEWIVKLQNSPEQTIQYYAQTQPSLSSHENMNQREFSISHCQKIDNSVTHSNPRFVGLSVTCSCEQFLAEIQTLLQCSQSAEEGFKVKTVMVSEQTKTVHQTSERTITKSNDAIVYSCFKRGEQIQIKVKSNEENIDRQNGGQRGARSWFFVDEIVIGNKQLASSNQALSSRQYCYRVRTVAEYLTSNPNRVRVPIFAIEEQLKAGSRDQFRYELSCNTTTFNVSEAMRPAYKSSQQQYRNCRLRKSNYHLGSLSFIDRCHAKLQESLNKALLNIYELYYHAKYVASGALSFHERNPVQTKEATRQDLEREVYKIHNKSMSMTKSYSSINPNKLGKRTKAKDNDCHQCSDRYRFIQSLYETKSAVEAANPVTVTKAKTIEKPQAKTMEKPNSYLAGLTQQYSSLEDEIKKEVSKNNISLADLRDEPSWKKRTHEYDLRSSQLRSRYRQMLTRIHNKFS